MFLSGLKTAGKKQISFRFTVVSSQFRQRNCYSYSPGNSGGRDGNTKFNAPPSVSSINPTYKSYSVSTSSPQYFKNFQECGHGRLNYVISRNKKITSYIRSGDFDSAFKVFEEMTERSTITWNSILAGFSRKSGKVREAKELFDRIPQPDTVSYNIMLGCYLKNGDVESGKSFFDHIPARDIASWNTMISGFLRNGMMREAKELFLAIPEKNNVTWNAMIAGYVESGDMESALELFTANPVKDVVAWTAIITGFMRCGKVNLAERLFREMPEKNLVTWNAMIAGYVENGRGEESIKLFTTMLKLRVQVNESSLSSVLLSCSNLSSLKLGKQVHQHVVKSPLYLDITVGTSLISMYGKCGDLEDAWNLFREMPRKDIVTWNAMISGYAQHGAGEDALILFDKMRDKGMKPDWITFVGILSACNHAGLVDYGIQYFDEMQKVYGIKPQPEHYTCMVDLLGRAGKLAEAMDLIKGMDFKPHAPVYGILLGACRIYKNVEVAEFAARNLLNLDPSNPASYVQLANVYDEFRSGDRVHPELGHIHRKLYELQKKMKLAGFVSRLDSDLHDVAEEQKEQLLLWHSEKLAVAFGLIRLASGMPIRIFKNLRVCEDCHAAIKLISGIEKREIVIRDTTRFHHFKDGNCSCGDYW